MKGDWWCLTTDWWRKLELINRRKQDGNCYMWALVKHRALNLYGIVEVKLHLFLTVALDKGGRSASRRRLLYPGVITCGIPWIDGWMWFTALVDAAEEKVEIEFLRFQPVILNTTDNGRLYSETNCTPKLILQRLISKREQDYELAMYCACV